MKSFIPILSSLIVLNGALLTTRVLAKMPVLLRQANGQIEESQTQLPTLLRNRLLRLASQETGLPVSVLQIVDVSQATWLDSCLGAPNPLELCTDGTMPGWQVTLSDGEMTWIYRTDFVGQVIRRERQGAEVGELPQSIADRVLDAIQQSSGLPVEILKVVATERHVWDGCLGLANPGQSCSKIAISGWRVIVAAAPDHVWIYHTNQDGTDIRLNETASQRGEASLVPELVSDISFPDMGSASKNALFSVMSSDEMNGRSSRTILYRNGAIARYLLLGNTYAPPTDLGRLSQSELSQFMQQLQALQLDHFQGLRYSLPAGTADALTVTLISGDSGIVQYADTAVEQLPPNLQQFLGLWHNLLTSAGARS